MSSGKAAAQAVHAAMMIPEEYKHEFSDEDRPYKRTVIILEAKTGTQLDRIATYLERAGIHHETYIDEGKNEVEAFSMTALAVETIDENDEETREIFSALPLYGSQDQWHELQDALAKSPPVGADTCATLPAYTKEQRDIMHLLAENKELRSLWSENEGDIIELKCMFNRYLRLNKRDRLKIGPDDPRLITDRKQNEAEEHYPRRRNG